MQSDINYLNNRLSKVDGFGDTGDYLLNIVNSKKIDSPPPAVPAKNEAEVKGSDSAKTEEKQDGEEATKKDGDSK